MQRTAARLADDREIIWFDLDGSPPRTATPDSRDLPTTVASSQLRLDVLTGEWIAMASHRQTRTFMPPADQCPLCPSRDGRQSEIPSSEYQVVAFENRFPSLSMRVEGIDTVEEGMARVRPGIGRCEVVCFSADHDGSFAALSLEQARLVVDVWADRTTALGGIPGIELVFPFENRGPEIGVTLQHPHGQIYGYPFVPPRARTQLANARAHLERTGRNLFGDVLEHELTDGRRVVVASEHWVAFVPYAARWPMEVHLFPRRQVADLPGLDDAERDDLARVYLDVLGRFDRLYSTPMPYIAAWQQAPVHIDRDIAWLHLELFSVRRGEGRLKYLAGSESGMGAFIGDVLPEQQADRLRAV